MSLKGPRKHDSEEEDIFYFEPHVESPPETRAYTPSQSAQKRKSQQNKPVKPIHENKLTQSMGFSTEEESDMYFRQNHLQSAPDKTSDSKKKKLFRPD